MRRALVLVLLGLCACHPPALPPRLEVGAPSKVEILLDERGIPHIYGGSLSDVSFGLGFMHGRDRLFQILLLRDASQGRLTELFGERMLQTDHWLRLIAWGLDDHLAALSPADRRVFEAYAAGLNAGAQHAGRSTEMVLLRVGMPQFTARDALSVMRLQAWQLAIDHVDEVVRSRLLELLPENDPRRAFIDAPVSSGGVSITGSGDGPPFYGSLSLGSGPAASNSWAVDGAHTASGYAVLSNDPHLDHSAPGVFYLAHLETPDFTAAGATLPGAPVVVIGVGRKAAWGMTSSFADTQDLLRIKSPPGRDDVYELDGELVPFERVKQTFVVGSKTIEETWLGTRFGPVLPEGYPGVRKGEHWALHWGGQVPKLNGEVATGFIGLAAAKDIGEANAAVEKVRGSSQNVLLAFTDGSVAYRLAAFTPLRPKGELGRLPRDGTKSANGFSGYLSVDERPKVDAPKAGFLFTANQRVIGDGDPRLESVGSIGVSHSRAMRIKERIEALLARAGLKPTTDELLAIQGDIESVDARLYLPKLNAICPKAEQPELCGAIAKFDGKFTRDAWGALPYKFLLAAITYEVVKSFGDIDEELVGPVASTLPIQNAVGRALMWPQPQTLIDKALVSRAAKRAHEQLVARAGEHPSQWRYGKLHTLNPAGPLAQAPVIGGYFAGETREMPGDGSTVFAEGGTPVKHGPCLRMVVEMSDPPVARFTLDTGQSGDPGSEHWMDQYDDWENVRPRVLPTVRSQVEAAARQRIELLP